MSERQQPEVHVHVAQQQQPEVHVHVAQQQPEIEVTMEPIMVGIEMGPEITINASGGGTITRGGNIPQDYLQVRLFHLFLFKILCKKIVIINGKIIFGLNSSNRRPWKKLVCMLLYSE